ncbi:MAG: hypothetical protein HUU16_01630 [Candidatus Omnitrophica bacterium]|nr:hypothetical protein [bacterium]NUN94848.1 hypothetical protein [Candidatus Omnitrophota bacterium]
MKSALEKLLKQFSKYRDWLLVLLAVGGIFFFMNKGQAIKEQDPEEIWQNKWKEVVRAPVDPGMPGQGGGGQGNSLNSPTNAAEIFRQVQVKDLDPISANPIFTEAGNYKLLKDRLSGLKKDYQDAIAAGDPKTAIKKLEEYCKDDSKGRILDWPSPPSEILANLICEDSSQALGAAIDGARSTSESASRTDQTDLYQSIEALNQAHISLTRAVENAAANPQCANENKSIESKLAEGRSLLDSLAQSRLNLNQTLIRREYDSLVRDGGQLDSQAPAETVAGILQRLRAFKDLLTQLDPDSTILEQAQRDRVQELQTKLEGDRESRINQVRQRISALAAVEGYQDKREALEEILKNFDTLQMLEDPKAAADRREYEGFLLKIRAAEGVAEIAKMLDSVDAEIEKLARLDDSSQEYKDTVQRIVETIEKVNDMVRTNKGIRQARAAYGEAMKRLKEHQNRLKQLRLKLK